MLYRILKIYVRVVMWVYCYKIRVNRPELLEIKGPLLLASNHPNSFLDGVVYDILFSEPVWSLARGDVFKSKWAASLLYRLKLYPVYRTRDGMGSLYENYKTFDASLDVFRKNGLVTIFSEGDCVNTWQLRSLKKGTARLAFKAWKENIPLRVLPMGINYSAFRRFGKQIDVNIGTPFSGDLFDKIENDGQKHLTFNKVLNDQLGQLVYEIKPGDVNNFDKKFSVKSNRLKENLLLLPAGLAWLLHAPFYYPSKVGVKRLCHDNEFYDSILFSVFIFLYPIYVLLLGAIAAILFQPFMGLILILILPGTALAYTKRKLRKDKVFHESSRTKQ